MRTGCGLASPVRDDIPVLLVDEARKPGWEGEARGGHDGDLVDESRLDDESAPVGDGRLRALGRDRCWVRRGRRRCGGDRRGGGPWAEEPRPSRAVVAGRPDSRLLRAVLEPRVPGARGLAWPALPGGRAARPGRGARPDGADTARASAVAEAVRRGCQVVVACLPTPLVADHAAGRWSILLTRRVTSYRRGGARPGDPSVSLGLRRTPSRSPRPRTRSRSPAPYAPRSTPRRCWPSFAADASPVMGGWRSRPAARRVAESIRRTSGQTAFRWRRRAPAACHRGDLARATFLPTCSPRVLGARLMPRARRRRRGTPLVREQCGRLLGQYC